MSIANGQGTPKKEVRKAPLTITTVALATATLAACATPAPPPPPPPPPPPVVVERTPYRPLPPGGAAYVMVIPGKNAMGQRETINLGISDDEKVWHFRSGWNVAALNCTAAQYDPILTAYSAFIKDYGKALGAVNDRIDSVYRAREGARRAGILAREEQMTAVYNFFALPPARARFCRAALDISNRYNIAPPQDAIAFAMDNFALLEEPFELFFQEYEQYQRDSAAWDAKWGDMFGPSQPGWVAVQAARASGVTIPTVESDPASTLAQPTVTAGAVTDPETGVAVPVVPVQENTVSQPVVEPVASEPGAGGSGGTP